MFPGQEYDVSAEAVELRKAMCEIADGHALDNVLELFAERMRAGQTDIAFAEMAASMKRLYWRAEDRIAAEASAARSLCLVADHGEKVS